MDAPDVLIELSDTKKSKKEANGFSLVELMVAMGIGTIVSLGVSTLFIFAVEQFTILVEQNNTEEELLWASYHTRSFLSQAVGLRTPDPAIPNEIEGAGDGPEGLNVNHFQVSGGGAATQGVILENYISSTDFDTAGNSLDIDLITLFPRENGFPTGSGNAFTGSKLFTSAIYFQRPTIGTAGKIYFIVGREGTGANLEMFPTDNEIVYDKITEFDLTTDVVEGTPAGNPEIAKSASIRIVGRYFRTADRNLQVWCPGPGSDPSAPIYGALCSPFSSRTNFRDIEMIVNVGFRNNALLQCSDVATGANCTGSANEYRERLHGGLYFYKMAVPPINF